MSKFINIRYPVFACLLLITSIFVVLSFVYQYVVIGVVLSACIVALLILIGNKNRWTAIVMLIIFMVGILSTTITYLNIDSNAIKERTVTLTGTVDDIIPKDYGVNLIIKNAYLDDQDQPLRGKVSVTVFGETGYIGVGDMVVAKGYISNNYVFRDQIDTYAYRNNTYYDLNGSKLQSVTQGKPSLIDMSRQYVFDKLATIDNGGLAYALLLGDKTFVEQDEYLAVKNAGIAHLLAVSGLHIGIIVMVLDKLLALMRVNQRYRLPIIIIPMMLYGAMCGYPPSMLRATIMAVFVMLSRLLFYKNDMLNSIASSALLILAIRPLYLFDVGFLLSYGAVIGILTITKSIERLLPRDTNAVIKYFVGLISVTIGATIATLCTMAHYFGSVATLGVIANIICIPIVTVAFVMLIISMLPFMQWLLPICDYMLSAVVDISQYLSSWQLATISIPSLGWSVVVLVIILVVVGGFVNVQGKAKRITVMSLCVVFVLQSILYCIPHNVKDEVKIQETYSDVLITIADEQSNSINVINNINSDYDVHKIVEYATMHKHDKMYIHVPDCSLIQVHLLHYLVANTNVDAIYIHGYQYNPQIEHLDILVKVPPNSTLGETVKITNIYDGAFVGYKVDTPRYNFAVVCTDNPKLMYYYKYHDNYDFGYAMYSADTLTDYISSPIFSQGEYGIDNIYSTNKHGDFTITPKNDTILVNRGVLAR